MKLPTTSALATNACMNWAGASWTGGNNVSMCRPTALHRLALGPFSPAVPSHGDVGKAKGSEIAAAAASGALAVLDQRQAEAVSVRAKDNEAAKARHVAKTQPEYLAGGLFKNGGLDLNVKRFRTSSDANEALYQAEALQP